MEPDDLGERRLGDAGLAGVFRVPGAHIGTSDVLFDTSSIRVAFIVHCVPYYSWPAVATSKIRSSKPGT